MYRFPAFRGNADVFNATAISTGVVRVSPAHGVVEREHEKMKAEDNMITVLVIYFNTRV